MNSIFDFIGNDILQINKITVPEIQLEKTKTKPQPFYDKCKESDIYGLLQGLNPRNIFESLKELQSSVLKELLSKPSWIDAEILGEYSVKEKDINYYNIPKELNDIVKTHERFHAIHHLIPDPIDNSIWEDYQNVSPFYTELLAQLFTFKFLENNHNQRDNFTKLSDRQSFYYKTWRMFCLLSKDEVEELYWIIRRKLRNNEPLGCLSLIERAIEGGFSEISIEQKNPPTHLINDSTLNCKSNPVFIYNAEYLQYEEELDKKIAKFCHKVVNHPIIYFSEADLHSNLFTEIMSSKKFSKLVDSGFAKSPKSRNYYKTQLVHREYGIEQKRRCDFAIFLPSSLKNTTNLILKDSADQYITPDFCIELCTEKSADQVGHVEQDLIRMENLLRKGTKKGYLIHFYRDTSTSPSSSGRAELTQKKIEEIQQEITRLSCSYPNVKVLAFFIRLYKDGSAKLWGKCSMFIPDKSISPKSSWKAINCSKIEKSVLEIIKSH